MTTEGFLNLARMATLPIIDEDMMAAFDDDDHVGVHRAGAAYCEILAQLIEGITPEVV